MITAKSFEDDPKSKSNHSMATAFGLIPSLAAWAWQLVQDAISATLQVSAIQNTQILNATIHTVTLVDVVAQLTENDANPAGMIALSQGYLLTSIVLASTVVHIIERHFLHAR